MTETQEISYNSKRKRNYRVTASVELTIDEHAGEDIDGNRGTTEIQVDDVELLEIESYGKNKRMIPVSRLSAEYEDILTQLFYDGAGDTINE